MNETAEASHARALEEATDRLRRAQQAAQLGTWDWDIASNKLIWDGVEAVHGLPDGSFGGTFEGYLQDMHPEDTERVLAAIASAQSSGTSFYVEYRIILPDESVRWVAGRGTCILENGVTTRMAGTCQDITDRKLSEQHKQELFSFAAHELRSPLTTIMGFSRMLERRIDKSPDDYDELTREGIATISRETQRMAEIVEAFLDLARADSDRIEVKPEAVELKDILEEEAENARTKVPEAVVSLNLPPEPPVIASDVRLLRRIVSNLVQNGLKYGGEPPEIHITCEADSDKVAIHVKDNGTGISAEDRSHLFERFYRGNADTGIKSGLGIGLYLSHDFTRRLGGTLELASQPGEPAEFVLTLPA